MPSSDAAKRSPSVGCRYSIDAALCSWASACSCGWGDSGRLLPQLVQLSTDPGSEDALALALPEARRGLTGIVTQ
jgi:hypothetical protein